MLRVSTFLLQHFHAGLADEVEKEEVEVATIQICGAPKMSSSCLFVVQKKQATLKF